MIGAYVGGFGTAPGLKTRTVNQYHAVVNKWYPGQPADDGFFYNYYQAARALITMLSLPGLAFAEETRSGTVLAGTAELTTST